LLVDVDLVQVQRRANAHARLAHARFSQTDEVEARRPAPHLDLDLNEVSIETDQPETQRCREHGRP
jgi:hypothetical protein